MNVRNGGNHTKNAILFDENRRDTGRYMTRHDYPATRRNEARVPTSQSSQTKTHRYCYEKTSYLVAVIVVGVLSSAISFYVLYQVLNNANTECQCTNNKNYIKGHAIRQNFTEVINDLKAKLEKSIKDLRNQMDNDSRTVNGGQPNSGDGFDAVYKKTEQSLERHYNQTETNISRQIQETNATIERIRVEEGKPKCLLRQARKSQNNTAITVNVPRRFEERVTVAVTCSTTLEHTADVRYLIPASEDDDVYTCYCGNKNTKPTDCLAYYWQCKL
ncbi:uncharacterized protein LOC114522250 [Dendronephthya gigantea]|uniref:uncharacterized protein LOC114522250 n=1 Tax=Dendronephthya gigantea TaxID=151771 RepID=UPI00106A2BB7|nr:uncharacterized protein LOC114522250 [Dendronephthya gigantea]